MKQEERKGNQKEKNVSHIAFTSESMNIDTEMIKTKKRKKKKKKSKKECFESGSHKVSQEAGPSQVEPLPTSKPGKNKRKHLDTLTESADCSEDECTSIPKKRKCHKNPESRKSSLEKLNEDEEITLLHQINGCTPNPSLLAELKSRGKCHLF